MLYLIYPNKYSEQSSKLPDGVKVVMYTLEVDAPLLHAPGFG
jgi:hypothetical protein